MAQVYRFEIYPNIHHLNSETIEELELKKWFSKYMDVHFDQIFKVKYFIVESKNAIHGIQDFAEEVFCDSVMERLFCSESENLEESHHWLKKRGFQNPTLIDISFRPGVTDNSAQAALSALKLLPAMIEKELKVSSGTMYYVEGENLQISNLKKLTYEKMANFLLHKVHDRRSPRQD
ncbi:MAG: hypothetical protein K2Q18_06805 [Bdellovibrionales bacterium]|nr:hypothetical protein [Bdellovibrionales bacterium]